MYNLNLIFNFLKECFVNNNTDWMRAHKPFYLEAKEEFYRFCDDLLSRMTLFDPDLKGLDIKTCVFRFNRDIRFSWDKSPYKDHFSVYFVPGGKKQVRAGYYFHLKPGDESLICCGLHCPPPEALKIIREEISDDGARLTGIIESRSFKKFYDTVEGDKAKKLPRGIESSDYDEYAKMKSFDACHYLADSDIMNPDIMDKIINGFKAGKPLNDFFNNILEDTHIKSVF